MHPLTKQDITVIVPGFNEEKHIGIVVQRTIKQGFTPVVVDDGSSDHTSEKAQEAGATVLKHVVNLGKGAAAKTGCDWALAKGAKGIILMDADGQHKPEDLPRMLEALQGTDIVFGHRKLDKNMPPVMRLGNWFINEVSTIINGVHLKDTQSGFRAMTADAYRKVRWHANDYGMESEMIAKVAKHKLRYRQIPIDTIYYDKFKGTTIFDGVKVVLRLFRWRLS